MLSSKTTLSQLPQIAYTIAKDKGWWEQKRTKEALVNLVMSEWAEALEGLRMGKICNGRDWDIDVVWEWGEGDFKEYFDREFKGRFITELADIIIRLLDWMGSEDLFFAFSGDFRMDNFYYSDLVGLSNIQQKMSKLRNLINNLDQPTLPHQSPYLLDKIIPIIWLCEDLARGYKCNLKDYILIKMKKNLSRSYKHGGKKF
jgi:hypothetical protein